MAELQERDTKLIQYLNEAYGKEKELETSLQAHIQMTTRDTYKKRLKDHLRETKQQSKGLQKRIKELGGKAEAMPVPGPDAVSEAAGAVTSIASKAVAAAKGPLHAVRGTSEQEMMLKNAKTEYWNEAEEIANYKAIETLAEVLGDKETVKLAREYRRQEERMSSFLEKTIPQLTKDVARAEIPASQRNGGKRTRRGGARSAGSKNASKARGSTAASKARGSTATAKSGASKAAAKTRASKAAAKTRGSKAAAKTRGSKTAAKTRASKAATKARGSSATAAKSRSSKAAAKPRGSTRAKSSRSTGARGRSKS